MNNSCYLTDAFKRTSYHCGNRLGIEPQGVKLTFIRHLTSDNIQ